MSPSRPFILRPIATSLLMAAILLVGIVAYKQLPVSALPEVDANKRSDRTRRIKDVGRSLLFTNRDDEKLRLG